MSANPISNRELFTLAIQGAKAADRAGRRSGPGSAVEVRPGPGGRVS